MGFISVILYIIYVLVCLFLVMVVLLQQGKGADLAGAFGGGGSQTSFGPRTSTNIMHRLTTVSFVLFVLLSVTLAVRSGLERGESVVAGVEQEQAVEEPAAEPGSDEPSIGSAEEETGEASGDVAGDDAATTELPAGPAAGGTTDENTSGSR